MAKLTITLACGDYDRTRALLDGRVSVEGVELVYLPLEPEEIFWRMLRHAEFDVSEMSLAMYAMRVAQGDAPMIAIPVFPSRLFRHSSIYVRADAGIEHPSDLAGRRVGTPEYQITAGVWVRGLLADEFGVTPDQMIWVTGGQEEPNRQDKVPLRPPTGIRIERAAPGETLNAMLLAGQLDALVTARPPSAFRANPTAVRRLFPDSRAVERDYFRRTGIFPIMHVIVIRDDVYRNHPWLATSLLKAFSRAKEMCYQRLRNAASLPYMLPWTSADAEEMFDLMGEDPWPYGLDANLKTVERLLHYLADQGLTDHLVRPEELFAPATLTQFKV